MNYKTHVCLVSAQAAPNLLPLLDDQLKPQNVILLVTPQMKEKAEWLANVITPRGIRVEKIEISTAADFSAIQEKLFSIIELHAENPGEIALNATGGTKWMSIAAQEIFRLNHSPVFYVDVETDHVHFLGENKPSQKLNQKIDIANYLKTYGYQITSEDKNGLSQAHKDLCEQMVLHVADWESAIGQLNLLANKAEENNTLTANIDDASKLPIYFDTLITECSHAGLIHGTIKNGIKFKDATARGFCNGGWLEGYVNRILSELRKEELLQEQPHLNIKVKKGQTSENEIDVAFMAKNRLHIIECKTKRFSGKQAGQAGTDTVYKLDSISELGGLGTKSMLVSYRPLKNADKQRAKDLRIEVIERDQIQNLKTHLKNWINK